MRTPVIEIGVLEGDSELHCYDGVAMQLTVREICSYRFSSLKFFGFVYSIF